MKRDMELVRLILLTYEGSEDASSEIKKRYGSEPNGPALIEHNREILVDAGYLHAPSSREGDPFAYLTRGLDIRLSWQGHEFLDAVRDETIWKTTKEKVLKPGASWTMSFLLEVAKAEIRKHLGLP